MHKPIALLLSVWLLGFLATAPLLAQPGGENDRPEVVVTLEPAKSAVVPGDQLAVAVVLDHLPGWHSHTNDPVLTPGMKSTGFQAIPTMIEITSISGATAGPIQWPKIHHAMVDLTGSGTPESYGVFSERAIAYIPLVVDPDATGQVALEVHVQYQACDATNCLLPVFVDDDDAAHTLTLPVVSLADAAGIVPVDQADFPGFDPDVFADLVGFGAEPEPTGATFNVFGKTFTINTGGPVGLILLFLAAALGGLLLNLTPCVLPVIPIKILGLSQAAANPARCFMLGVVMSIGVVAFWLGIGGAIAFISGFNAINTLFQQPYFSIAVGIVIAIMALGMIGLFATRLPQWVYKVNPKHDSIHGSLLFGIMTAILSTPCTAPFMGSAAAWATQQSPWITMSTFAAIGLGMALPYIILSANPKWIDKLPRTGPASELVKQVMGLLMLGVAVFFLGTGLDPLTRAPVDPPFRGHWWLIAAIVIAAAVWLVYKTFRITRSPVRRIVWTIAALVVSVAGVAVASAFTAKGPIDWTYYTPDRFTEATARGDVVVVDFTAEWCLNCKTLETTVLHSHDIADRLNGEGVTPMKVDITGGYPDGKAFMKELKWSNVPLLAIFGPGLDQPLKYDSYTISTVLDAIELAKGGN